jgi:hypothetical protein
VLIPTDSWSVSAAMPPKRLGIVGDCTKLRSFRGYISVSWDFRQSLGLSKVARMQGYRLNHLYNPEHCSKKFESDSCLTGQELGTQ